MSRDISPFGLRMQPDLKKMVEDSAKNNGRSINAEIISRLQASFVNDQFVKSDDFLKAIAEIKQLVKGK